MPVTFTYDFAANPQISYVRLLIGDTNAVNAIFGDDEILAAYQVTAATFQSGMLYNPPGGSLTLPSQPVSYLRVAALLLDALASSKARFAATKLLDVQVDFAKASAALHAQAVAWRELEDNSGAFAIIEQCTTGWGFLDRFYKQVQRQTAL